MMNSKHKNYRELNNKNLSFYTAIISSCHFELATIKILYFPVFKLLTTSEMAKNIKLEVFKTNY